MNLSGCQVLCCCCLVAKSCLTLCDPWIAACQCFIISWSLFKLMFIELVMPSNHLILCCPFLLPQSFPAWGSFPISQLFTSGDQSIGALASASVLPMNIQGWFPLELTGLISLQFEGLYVHDLKAPSQGEAWIKSSSPTLFIIVGLGLLVGRNLGDLKNGELWIKSPRSKGRNIYSHEYF